jgi:hypothetical protein
MRHPQLGAWRAARLSYRSANSSVIDHNFAQRLPGVGVKAKHRSHEDVVDSSYIFDLAGRHRRIDQLEVQKLHEVFLVSVRGITVVRRLV